MFSVAAIVGIFIELFTCGILCAGTYTFAKKYSASKEKINFYLFLIFLLSLLCTSSAVLSKILFNLDEMVSHIISNHILNQRFVSALLAAGISASWYFWAERFKAKSFIIPQIFFCLSIAAIIGVFYSYTGLPFKNEYAPQIELLCMIFLRISWVVTWLILGFFYLLKKTNENTKERNLNILCGISAVFIALGYSEIIYFFLKQEISLLISWFVTFISFSGFLLGNVIDQDDDIALSPLNFIRTRILFKLILIFVFMAVLIVEATTIATITISRSSFSKIITDANRQIIFSEMRIIEANSLLFVIIGIIITTIVGTYFAKNIERSIKDLIDGTHAIKKGDFKYKIKSGSIDEIGQLAQAFNDMTGVLADSQEHLVASEKLAALGTMAAGMAHEIKNPLVALRTFTQILPIKWNDTEFREKFIAIVPTEIEKINKIADSLLKFGRPSKPEFKTANANTILEEVLELLENQFKKNNIRITTKLAQTPMINGDPGQLSQAFLNILLNASEAMHQGGELIVKTDIGEIIKLGHGIAPREKIPTVFIEITDTGEGIPEKNLKNLFDPFFTTKEKGTGMGLPITLRIIEDHNGSIKVKSQIGKGTTFLILLPEIKDIKQ